MNGYYFSLCYKIIFQGCFVHKRPQCFQCNYEKNCSGSTFTAACEIMDLTEYKRLLYEQKQNLQTNANAAIDVIRRRQYDIGKILEADPRIDMKIRINTDAVESFLQTSVDVESKLEKKFNNDRHRRNQTEPTMTFNPFSNPFNNNPFSNNQFSFNTNSPNENGSTLSGTSSYLANLKFTNLRRD